MLFDAPIAKYYSDIIAIGDNDGRIMIWNINERKVSKMIDAYYGSPLTCLSMLCSNVIVSGAFDNIIKIWNIDTQECLKKLS